MDAERHLEIIRAEGARLAAMPADAIHAPVPAVEGWKLEDVVRHTGKVHRWVTAVLGLAADADIGDAAGPASLPHGAEALTAYASSLDALLAAFARRDPVDPIPTFAGYADVAWWARRQAHEVSVHRIDAADAVHAAGGPVPAPLAVDGAADGIDEWARFFLAVRWNQRFGPFPADLDGRTVHIHGTDDPPPPDGAEWLLRFGDGTVEVDAAHAKGDVALRGSTQSLFLTLWRRRPLADLDAFGDGAFADRVLDLARF